MRRLLLEFVVGVLALVANNQPLWAAVPPHTASIPGGVVVIALGSTTRRPPVAHFLNNRVMIQWHDKQWQAVVGIPLNIPPGEYPLHVQTSPETIPQNFPIVVETKEYETQTEPVAMNTEALSAAEKSRVKREKRETILSLRHWEEHSRVPAVFQAPVRGIISHSFGSEPITKSRRSQPLEGVHIVAAQDTPVQAPARGIVVTTGDYFFDGKTVFIDHGQGLVTMFSHLSHISVTPGQAVKQGETIGTVGMTGKVNKPQLQWRVSLNGAAVDPLLFLPEPGVLAATVPQTSAQVLP